MTWLNELWSEPGEKRVSHSRLLALAAFLVVSWVIVKKTIAGAEVDSELLIGYLAIMVLGETSKGISRHRMMVDQERTRMSFTSRGVGDE